MNCAKCQARNLSDARFCEACGAPLETACPACGTNTRPNSKFCRQCGFELSLATPAKPTVAPAAYTPPHLANKILTSRSALEGERKQVTVLFADVKGSLELAEQVDPEEWHRIMERFFEILTAGVHRLEGTINQYTGDGIMALFGAPIAHEDHAQRACFAALHLRDALRAYADELRLNSGLNFSVRMGMNSGEVVVGKIGDDLRMDYTAQGHAVGLAARMEQLAEPGTVLMTEHTAKLVSGYFALRDLGASTIKGVSEPLHVYELAGVGAVQTRFDRSQARGLSRFVGRERETAVLETAMDRALAGEGQVVGIVAEAGAGKTRLCYEFTQQCRRQGIEVLVASATPYGRSVPFLPVLQLLRALCGVSERETGDEARRKIAGALLLRDESFRDDLPLLFDFLGVEDPDHPGPRAEPEVLQRRLFSVIQRLIRTRASSSLAVLLFEDLHWIDGASAAALETLIEAVPATRTLLLLNFRSEFQAAWMKQPSYQQVVLQPLAADASAELLADLFGPDPSLSALAARIRERAAGNPFFIEEIVQSLIETGALAGTRGAYRLAAAELEPVLPATVHANLAARIDRLSEDQKHILQAAAVIGKEFAAPLLQRIAERSELDVATALNALLAGEFAYQTALYPEPVYAFKHPLTQEVAYRSQLGERRARLHARVAPAIEALYPDKLDENAALLAHHWEHAGEAAVAAEWHRRAAVWVGVRDRSEMLRHWRQVRTLLDTTPATPESLPTRVLARIQILHNRLFLGQPEDDSAQLFREGAELVKQLHDPNLHVWLLGEYAMTQQQVGVLSDGLVHAQEGVRLADATGDTTLRLMIRVALMWVLLQSGRLQEAVVASDEAGHLSQGDPQAGADVLGFSPYGSVLTLRAASLSFQGRLAEAAAVVQEAIELGQRRGDAEVLQWAHTWGVQGCWIAGDPARALEHGRRGVEFGEVAGSAGLRAAAWVGLARAYLLNEQPPEALDALSHARNAAGWLSADSPVDPLYLAVLGRVHLAMHAFERARECADRAVADAGERPTLAVAALLTRVQVLATDGVKAAAAIEADLDEADRLVAMMGAHGLAPFVREERALLARLRGDEAESQRQLREAHQLFSAIGAKRQAARLAREVIS